MQDEGGDKRGGGSAPSIKGSSNLIEQKEKLKSLIKLGRQEINNAKQDGAAILEELEKVMKIISSLQIDLGKTRTADFHSAQPGHWRGWNWLLGR